jgi:single-stranded DNA-binding protein
VNICFLVGVCSTEPEVRSVPSGARVANLNVRTELPGQPATSVPVAVWNPPAWIESLAPGTELMILGAVQRRFFSTSNGTGSRGEVVAVTLARASDRRRRAAVVRRRDEALAGYPAE